MKNFDSLNSLQSTHLQRRLIVMHLPDMNRCKTKKKQNGDAVAGIRINLIETSVNLKSFLE